MIGWLLRLLGVEQGGDPGPVIRSPKYIPGMEKPDGREKMAPPRPIPQGSPRRPFAIPDCQFHDGTRSVTCCEVCFAPLCSECAMTHHHPVTDYHSQPEFFGG